MDKVEVSVIVPIYNKEQYLNRCIDSIRSQTFQNFEVILVDDESSDRSGEIADNYAVLDDRIRVIHQKNRGEIGSRRTGIEAAKADYLVFVDADDSFPENAIEILYTYCTTNNLDIVFGAYKRIESHREYPVFHPFSGIVSSEKLVSYLMDLRSICLSSNFSKKEIWHKDVFFDNDEKYPNADILVNIRLSKYIRRAGIINDIVYNYYCVSGSLSVGGVLNQQHLWKRYFELLETHLKERGLYEENKRRFQILEIDRLAFYLKDIDKTDEWVKRVLSYNTAGFPFKSRMLQFLIHFPRLRYSIIKMNRYIKFKLGK